MKQAQRSELRETLLHLTALRASLETLRREAGKDLSVDESFTISQAEDELNRAIRTLTGVI